MSAGLGPHIRCVSAGLGSHIRCVSAGVGAAVGGAVVPASVHVQVRFRPVLSVPGQGGVWPPQIPPSPVDAVKDRHL